MPEYHIPMGSFEDGRRFAALDAFTQGYIEAAFFTDASAPDDGDLQDASFAEVAPSALDEITADCASWQMANVALLDKAYERDGYDAKRAGNDYWFSRNGHGVGFWARKELRADGLGDALHAACKWREVHVYRGDDGLIYFD